MIPYEFIAFAKKRKQSQIYLILCREIVGNIVVVRSDGLIYGGFGDD